MFPIKKKKTRFYILDVWIFLMKNVLRVFIWSFIEIETIDQNIIMLYARKNIWSDGFYGNITMT